MPLNAVIFDMDGVLCATDEYHYRSWKQVVSAYGINFSRQDNQALLGLTRRRSLLTLLKGRTLPEEQMDKILRRKNEVFLELVQQMDEQDLLPGVKDLLEELSNQQIRLGVASASRNTGPVLRQLGLDRYMDVVVDGNTVSRSKPAPDVFLKAALALGKPPSECLVIEDSQAGVRAALRAGIAVLGIGPSKRLRGATALVPDLSGIGLKDLQMIHKRWEESKKPYQGKEHPLHTSEHWRG